MRKKVLLKTCLGYVKCIVSMATPNAILEWGCAFKSAHISAATYPRLLTWYQIKPQTSALHPFVAYANYLLCTFINIYENIKKKCDSRMRAYLQNQ